MKSPSDVSPAPTDSLNDQSLNVEMAEDIDKAKEEVKESENQLNNMGIAITELVTYLTDLAEINIEAGNQISLAVDSQFKEIRAVNTGVNL